MENKAAVKLADMINLAEDFYSGGFRREHPDLPLRNIAQIQGDLNEGASTVEEIAEAVKNCKKCQLASTRNLAVPGEGVLNPIVLVIGEAPGGEEDESGKPFVGKAGKYLDKWLSAIDLFRDTNVFIANVVKCRPPANRDPSPLEIDACFPYLRDQIKLLKPKAILALGRISAKILTASESGIGRLRGKAHYYDNIPLVATYHPAAVLRNQDYRKEVWDDLKLLKDLL